MVRLLETTITSSYFLALQTGQERERGDLELHGKSYISKNTDIKMWQSGHKFR
jgi:hypothetical protein